jgi:hypothetical protein
VATDTAFAARRAHRDDRSAPVRRGGAVHTRGVRFAVVPGRSRIDLAARPALPGVRLVVEAVDGGLWATSAGDPAEPRRGAPGDDPGGGPAAGLRLRVRALTDGDPPAVALPPWLAGGDAPATVEVRPAGAGVTVAGDTVQARVEVRAGGHVAVVAATGRWHPVGPDGLAGSPADAGAAPGPVEAAGTAVVDLRGLGFGLPPLITYVVQVRWRLLLIPAEREATAVVIPPPAGTAVEGRRTRTGPCP